MKFIGKIGFVLLISLISSSAIPETFSEKVKRAKDGITAASEYADTKVNEAMSVDVVELSAAKITAYSAEVAEILPVLERLGFSISTFRMEIVPPTGKLRLVSRTASDVSAEELESFLQQHKSVLQKVILTSAVSAKAIQKMMKLEIAVMDVQLGFSPDIKISYIKSANNEDDNVATSLSDIDLLCGKAL